MNTEVIVSIIMGILGVILIALMIRKSRKVNRNLLMVLGISFLIFAVLSWVIPVGTYSGGKLSTTGISPVGLVDLVNMPISAFITFILYGVVFAVIGGLYGVIEKTGALDMFTERVSARYTHNGKESKFLCGTIILLIVLSSLTGLVLPLFVLVPLFAAILFKMNYDKITVLAATVGSLLVGNVVSTYGFNITGYTKNLLSLDMNNQIWTRLILFVLLTILYALIVVRSAKKGLKDVKKAEIKAEVKKEVKEAKKEIKGVKKSSKVNTTKKASKKSNTRALAVTKPVKKVSSKSEVRTAPLIVILICMLVVAFAGMYNWYYSFGIDLFNNMHEAVMGVKIGEFAIFEKLLNGVSQFGYWSNVEFIGLMIVTSMVIGLVYKLSLNDFIEGFIAGAKKWIPTAIYAALASMVLVVLYQALQMGSGTFVNTINGGLFGLVDGFNPFIVGVSALISGFFFNDLYYLLAALTSFINGFDASSMSIAGVLIQSVYGIAMMIFPTSIVLIAGLSHFDVSYKKWIKYIWRFALIAFLLLTLVCGVLTLL